MDILEGALEYSLLNRRGNSSCNIHQHQGGFGIDILVVSSHYPRQPMYGVFTYMKTIENKPNVGNNYPTWMTWVLIFDMGIIFPT